jgi:bacillithiol biosynthesis deacetylase BshB1
MQMQRRNKEMDTKLDILIFAAHPDDAEIGMGGTIAKQIALGYKVGVCDLTQAECSSNGTPELRMIEAEEASVVLGLHYRSNLHLPDRGISSNERQQIDRMVEEIRRTKPDVVFAPFIQDRHPDHEACGAMTKEAVFNAKLRKILPELLAWQVKNVYYYFINDVNKPDFIVDISEYQGIKEASLLAYKSQFTTPGVDNDFVDTPLNQDYIERVALRDRLLGQTQQLKYAEGFMAAQPIQVERFV